jgi:hypothetical protein
VIHLNELTVAVANTNLAAFDKFEASVTPAKIPAGATGGPDRIQPLKVASIATVYGWGRVFIQ